MIRDCRNPGCGPFLIHSRRVSNDTSRVHKSAGKSLERLMKLVTAIIKPFKVDEVREALPKPAWPA